MVYKSWKVVNPDSFQCYVSDPPPDIFKAKPNFGTCRLEPDGILTGVEYVDIHEIQKNPDNIDEYIGIIKGIKRKDPIDAKFFISDEGKNLRGSKVIFKKENVYSRHNLP